MLWLFIRRVVILVFGLVSVGWVLDIGFSELFIVFWLDFRFLVALCD